MFITFKSVKFRKCLACSVFNFHINRNLENTQVHLCIPKDERDTKVGNVKLPEEPQNCCMSGCANCVWVAYAEELAKVLNDGGETARQKIMEHVKDPNLRAFLIMELRHLFDEK